MQGAPIGASEGGGDALLSFEDPSNGVPTRVLAGFAQTSSDELYELVGDDADEQMSFGADGLVVEDGSLSVHLLRAGVDINTIRAWLGHVSLETTNRYAEVDLEMKAKALQTCAGDGLASAYDCTPRWHADSELMTFLASL